MLQIVLRQKLDVPIDGQIRFVSRDRSPAPCHGKIYGFRCKCLKRMLSGQQIRVNFMQNFRLAVSASITKVPENVGTVSR